MTINKNLRDLLNAAMEQGWAVSRTRNGHWRCVPPEPNNPIVVTGSTASDRRSLSNFRSQLRRGGLDV